tara:strand:+ start:2596 stop:2799 length:204 start_codon:yes stop_codon:yes gene_type:complete
MKSTINKYRFFFILLFIFMFIYGIDSLVLNGSFKGVKTYKHFIYIGCLVTGVLLLVIQILKEDDKNS